MNSLNIFLEHIYEGAAQQGISVGKMLMNAKNAGYDGLECDLWRLAERSDMKCLFDSCGLRTESVYNTFDFGHDDKDTSLKKIHSCFETVSYMGADKVLCIAGFIREGDSRDMIMGRMCETLNVMCEAAKDYGITVTMEDYDDKIAPFSTIAGLEYFLSNTEGLGFTFDTGNFAYSLEDAGEAYERLGRYIKHVHLKDRSFDVSRADSKNTNGKAMLDGRIMYPCEAGDGFIGIKDFVHRLIDSGYKGSFSIEHFGAADQLGYMIRSAGNVKSMISERI